MYIPTEVILAVIVSTAAVLVGVALDWDTFKWRMKGFKQNPVEAIPLFVIVGMASVMWLTLTQVFGGAA